MTLQAGDRVKETTTVTGTGSATLLGAATQYRAFSDICANGDRVHYAIVGQTGSEWEVGLGTWLTGGTLQRDVVLGSSNAGALVSFSAGTKDVFCTYPAAHAVNPPVRLSCSQADYVLPESSSLYAAGEYEIDSGRELELLADAEMEVG